MKIRIGRRTVGFRPIHVIRVELPRTGHKEEVAGESEERDQVHAAHRRVVRSGELQHAGEFRRVDRNRPALFRSELETERAAGERQDDLHRENLRRRRPVVSEQHTAAGELRLPELPADRFPAEPERPAAADGERRRAVGPGREGSESRRRIQRIGVSGSVYLVFERENVAVPGNGRFPRRALRRDIGGPGASEQGDIDLPRLGSRDFKRLRSLDDRQVID